jgi:hypothetical protein
MVAQVGALERAYYEIAAVFAGCDGACGDSLISMTPAMTAQAPMEAHRLPIISHSCNDRYTRYETTERLSQLQWI